MLARLKIGPKLLLAPGVALLLLVVLSCGAYYAMVRQNQSLETIVQQRVVHIRSASSLVASVQKVQADTYQLITWISGSFARSRVDPLIRDIHRQHAAIERGFVTLSGMAPASGAERRYVQQAASAYRRYLLAVRDVMELAEVDQSISASAMVKADAAFGAVAKRLTDLTELEHELGEQASESAAADFRTMQFMMPCVILLSIVLSLAITMAVRRALLTEIRGIGAAAIDLASGDLTVKDRVYGNDEIADTSRALDASIRNLNRTLRTILESARSIGSASREIALGNAHLSKGGGVRASLEHTASSMQELAATVNLTADSAQAANRLAESASSVAQRGGGVVERLVTTMESVKGSSRKVAGLGGLIGSIANQTATLALNAALEAARAGEQGRDFALLASEVRALAQRSAAAAREIRELAGSAVAEIEGGTGWAAEAGNSMADIASSVQQVGDIITQISCASAEQANGLSEVNQAIVQMDEISQKNSVLVEEAASAARSLQEQALTLSRAVAAFRLDEPLAPPPRAAGAKTPAGTSADRAGKGAHPYIRLASSRG